MHRARGSGGGPEPLEVRLHAPTREVVVVWVSGRLDTPSVALLAERVSQQFARAPHVVIDLGDVTFLGVAGVEVLRFLHRQAAAVGTSLHLAAEDDAVRRPLHVAGLDQLLPIRPTAAAVIARLAHHPACTPGDQPAPQAGTGGLSRQREHREVAHLVGSTTTRTGHTATPAVLG